MSFQLNLPPSVVSQMAKDSEQEGAEAPDVEAERPEGGKKREDWRKLKELEEARKAGTAPAMQDEEGRDINPHIPQYIMQAPWYFGATQPTLKHQRPQEEKQREFSSGWYKRGVKEGAVATKFRKGACENCGSITHKKKDCLERPRKVGTKFTGKDFAPDEHIQPELEFDYDGKRDRWNGYNTTDHKRIVEEFQKIDEAKRLLKAQRVEDAVQKGEMAPEEAQKAVEDEDEEDEDKYADDVDMPGQKFETKQRITVRNLRIREDTAKYLYNLDVNSAYYDPKTRSMRENPFKNIGKEPKDLPYAGDNFVRWSGDAMEMAKQQLFAWEAYEKGSEVNLQADPTKLDMLTQEYEKKKDEYKKTTKESILDKYGGQEHLEAPPKQLLVQSEEYVEYSRHGTLLQGQEKAKVKSKYEEDVFPNNHTSVWGSFWKECQWGYKCCHSFIRESYCTGAAGKEAEKESIIGVEETAAKAVVLSPVTEKEAAIANHFSPPKPVTTTEQQEEESTDEDTRKRDRRHRKKEKKKRKKQKEKERKKRKKKKKRRDSSSDSSDSSSESEDEETKRERRILEAVRKEEERLMEVDRMLAIDERKRKYNVTYNGKGPTEEEIEAYQRKRPRDEDPMAQFV